jgi:ABC-2 type transport system permease protein
VTGTLTLARLALRRDRIRLAVWVIALTGVLASSAASLTDLLTARTERAAQAGIEAENLVSRVFNGPALGSSIGAITYVESFGTLAVLAALMTSFAVVRHSRQNEETGRAELVGSTVVGRHAGLFAALLVSTAAALALGLFAALTLVAYGLPVAGSAAAGAGLAGVGFAFAAVAAVAAQVLESARGANGLAAAAIGLAFILRASGDAFGKVTARGVESTSAWPAWLSPLGWANFMRPYDENSWWLLLLFGALGAGLVALAFTLSTHRDVGAGMLPARRGPAHGARSLLSPTGLAWRLQRGVLLGWAFGIVVMGVSMGLIGNEADEVLTASAEVEQAFRELAGGGSLVDAYFAAIMALIGLAVGAYAVQSLLRLRAEETVSAESILATSVSRPRWVASHVVCAVSGAALLLALAGVSAGAAFAISTGQAADLWPVLGAALVQLPAVLAVAGFVVAAFGLLPRRLATVAWAGLGACLLLGQLGEILKLPQAVVNLSPFGHIPTAPVQAVIATPLIALTAAAAGLGIAGLVSFRRRDLAL